jgi:TfoX/Sxy family transcriptional regulator of competence genes
MAHDEKTAQRVRRLLASRTSVSERKMMGALCFMVDGNLCCCVKGDALLVRVDGAARERALAEAGVKPASLRDRVMKSFVLVDAAAIASQAGLRRWVQRGLSGVPAKTKRATRAGTAPGLPVDPKFAPVVAAFADDPQVTAGKMMASLGLKVGGKIFAMMARGKFVAKLPKERVAELVRSGAGAYFDPRRDGRLMKEWVELSGTKPSWVALAKEAHRFVSLGR